MFIAAWHVRLKQYYPDSLLNQDIKHSRVVTGVNSCHTFREKKDLPDQPVRPHQPASSEFIASGSSSDEESSSPRKKPRRRSSSSPDRKKKPNKDRKDKKPTEKKFEKSSKGLQSNGGVEEVACKRDFIKGSSESSSVTTNGVCVPSELKPIDKIHRVSTSSSTPSKHSSSKDHKVSSKHHSGSNSSSSQKHKESKHSSRENQVDGSKSTSKAKSSSSSSTKHRDKQGSSCNSLASKSKDNSAVRNLSTALEGKSASCENVKLNDTKQIVSESKKTKDSSEPGHT